MALSQLVRPITRTTLTVTRKDNSKDIFPIDVVSRISPNFTAEVTKFPVEKGGDITDHTRVRPITIDIEGVISETPLTLKNDFSSLTSTAASLVGSKFPVGWVGSTVTIGLGVIGSNLVKDADNPAEAAKKALSDMLTQSYLISVTSKGRDYPNMIMTSLSFPSDASTGHAVAFRCTLEEVRFAESKVIEIQKDVQRAVAGTALKKENKGTQNPKTPTPEVTKGATLLHSGFSSIKSSFQSLLGGN